MTVGVESTHRIAELTLAALKKIGLPATPANYEVWYAHAEGKNPSLSRDIQKVMDGFGKVSQADAEKLHQTHIQHADLSRDVVDIVTRFQEEVTDLYDVIERTGENTVGHNEALDGLSDQLRQTTKEFPAVGKLLEGMVTVAKGMHSQNEELETRLADSVTEIHTLQRNVEYIQAEAMKDPLTGIANRAMFDQSLERFVGESAESNEDLALVMADVDHFKNFNDKWGHQTGDQVLRLVAEVMNANVKGQDLLARYGGEEFAIILPGTSLEHAQMLADRIRRAVESRRLRRRRTDENLGVVTMSMGISAHRKADTIESIIERADQCLYAAKESGRNQVITEDVLTAKRNEPSAKAG